MEKVPESNEIIPTEPDLRVDFIRHGKPEYTSEEWQTAKLEGTLTEEGRNRIRQQALELANNIDKEKELVILWVSPRRRAQQTAEIIFGVFEEQGVPVIRDPKTINSLHDITVTKEFIENLTNGGKKWFEYWMAEELPEGTETPEEVKIRVQRVITYLERIARSVVPPDNKKLHFICVGHEEIFDDLTEEGYGLGIKGGTGPIYGEIMSIDIKKSEQGQDAVLKLKYRGQETNLDFDKKKREFHKKHDEHR